MLSSKGTFCAQKDVVLSKMLALLNQLQSLKNASEQRMEFRQQQADAAKQNWLDAEGRHAVLKKTVERDELNVKDALKKVCEYYRCPFRFVASTNVTPICTSLTPVDGRLTLDPDGCGAAARSWTTRTP